MPFWSRSQPEDDGDLRLVVGLGNPGPEYAMTRHNVGFMLVDTLAERYALPLRSSKQRADVGRGRLGNELVILAKPLTYMNESGFAVSRLVHYYHVPLARLLVVCDDIDLPFGTLRLRPGGNSGGNNGLKSIIRELGTTEFARLRLGVGRPHREAVSHVLSRFPPDQEARLPAILRVGEDAVRSWMERGVHASMNEFNRDWSEELTV